MSTANWVRIRLALVYENGGAHPPMEGKFSHGQLVETKTINGASSVTWTRRPMETCEEFERRLIENLCDMQAEQATEGAA
jgi:hypothetical protein